MAVADGYATIRGIGRGAFAACTLVRHRRTGFLHVCKILNAPLSELTEAQRDEAENEVRLLRLFAHANIVRYVDSFVSATTNVQHIVMDFCAGGTLAKAIERRAEGDYIDEAQIMEWFVQMVDGLAYVHAQGVLHRDLKPQNLLLWGRGQRARQHYILCGTTLSLFSLIATLPDIRSPV